MARPGITKQEVFAAANRLVAENKDPTIDLVRQITQTGSHSTIAMHLRDWRAAQTDTQALSVAEGLPHEMVVMMKSLWQRLTTLSTQKAVDVEASLQVTIEELSQEVNKYKSNNQRWQQLFNQWQQEKQALANDKLALEQAVEGLQVEKLSFEVKLANVAEQFQEKQDRVSELNRLLIQAQANLEHYRESMREQRLVEQQQFDQQKGELAQEIKTLKEQVALTRDKAASIEQRYVALQQQHAQLELTSSSQEQGIHILNLSVDELKKAKFESQQMSQHWQTQYESLAKVAEERAVLLNDRQYEVKLLMQKLDDSKQLMVDLQDQNKILAHDKWTFAQEKAQLEGQLKQFQKMMSKSLSEVS